MEQHERTLAAACEVERLATSYTDAIMYLMRDDLPPEQQDGMFAFVLSNVTRPTLRADRLEFDPKTLTFSETPDGVAYMETVRDFEGFGP